MKRRGFILTMGGLALTSMAGKAFSNSQFPDRPITLVVPYSPGGATDNVARVFAEQFQSALGRSVIVDNRAGANGRIGTQAVARSSADGYTLLLGGIGPLTIAPHIEEVPYDPIKDFSPISLLVTNDVVLLAHPSIEAANVGELIDYLKANPDTVNFASSGTGGPFHMSGELFKSMAGVDMTHVPYKGDGPALVDLMAGNVQVMFTTVSASRPHFESGRIKLIASAGQQRSSQLPELPTIEESGLPGFSSETWQGLFAPQGTPEAVITILQDAVAHAMQQPALREALARQGNSIVTSNPEHLQEYIRTESDKWEAVVRQAGVKA